MFNAVSLFFVNYFKMSDSALLWYRNGNFHCFPSFPYFFFQQKESFSRQASFYMWSSNIKSAIFIAVDELLLTLRAPCLIVIIFQIYNTYLYLQWIKKKSGIFTTFFYMYYNRKLVCCGHHKICFYINQLY